MTVKQLRRLIVNLPDNMVVYLMDEPEGEGFILYPACSKDSQVVDIEEVGEILVLAKHGALDEPINGLN